MKEEGFVLKNKTKKYKLLSLFVAMAMVFCMIPAVALAAEEGEVVKITNSQELIDAINNQKDNQTWELAAGTYDVADGCLEHVANMNGVEKGFVFPIHANNITIKGMGDVTITSEYDSNTGNWAGQNFITVGGSNVTIEDVKLKGNYNSYYEGCNKVLELIGNGKNLALRNVECLALTKADGTQNSGSIYINVADAGNTVLENVTLYSWINARAVTAGTVTANNVVQDFTKNEYAGYSDPTYGYAWDLGITGNNVVLNGFTIKVDNKTEFVKQIMDKLQPGTTIELMSDIEVSEEVYINGIDNVTINGNGHTITAADDFKMNTAGQIELMKIQADNVTLNDVNLVATAANKHTLDVWGSQNVQLNNVTLNHENAQSGAPLVVNGSDVTVSGNFSVVTGDNSWYGVNLDNKNGNASLTFAEDATLTFTDNSSTADKIFVVPEASNPNNDAPTVENNSENIQLDTDENGNLVVHTHQAEHVQAKAATCTEDGNIEYWYCPACGSYFSDAALTTEITLADTVVKAVGHQAEKVEAKPATETEAGNIEYWYCAACGKYFKDEALTQEITLEDTVIAALGNASQQTPSQGQQMDSPQTGDSGNTTGMDCSCCIGSWCYGRHCSFCKKEKS